MKKILILDNDPLTLELLQVFLERKGFSVMTTSRVATAFKLIHGYKPDIIVLDIFLGQFDSRDICHEIKRNAATSYIHIILMASVNYLSNQYNECDDFIEKPIDTSLLLEKLRLLASGFSTV